MIQTKSYQTQDEEKQRLLQKAHRIWCNGFFVKAQKHLFPEIRLTSDTKPYRPFRDFLTCLRKMFSVVDVDGCRYDWRYGTQIDPWGWRKTSKKELGKRAGLTENQVRECLRLAEEKKFLERRHKGLGKGKGATLEIRIDFTRLEQNIMSSEEGHAIKLAPPAWRKNLNTEVALDGGNSPRQYTIYNNNDTNDNVRIEVLIIASRVKIKTNPAGLGGFQKGKTPAKEKKKEPDTFVVNEKEMEMVQFLQSGEFISGFPSPVRIWERIPVSWSPSLFALFLSRVRCDGLDLKFLRSYEQTVLDDHEGNLSGLFRLSFQNFLRFFPKHKDFFIAKAFGEDLFSRQVQAKSFIDMANMPDLEIFMEPVQQFIGNRSENGAKVANIEGKIMFFDRHVREIHYQFRDFAWLAFFHFEPEFLGPELTEEAFRIHRQTEKESMANCLAKMLCFHRLKPDFLKRIFLDDEDELGKLLDYAEKLKKWAESITLLTHK
ncbi:MAG: hypothetical protein HN531_11090 [Opitutae bacterium]|jgi:hypothetical protein|nr:hypothetical protein [Opitutae bacterium]